MVVSQKYNVFDLEKGLLDQRVFTDEKIYQDELERIFGRAWLTVSHESLVPNPADFFLSYIGEDPVIVTRDSKGEIHVFLNMCRHRGNRIVRADDGNAKNFMCAYHGWTYSNEGKLVSVPGLQEAYYGELDVEHLGLVEARCDIYAGFIFATWADDAPTLEAYLGDARWYLDAQFNRRDCGLQAIGPQKWIEPLNWKTPVDNSSDMYHTSVAHRSVALVNRNRVQGGGRPGLPGLQQLFQNPLRLAYANGHSFFAGLVDDYYAMLTNRGPYPGSAQAGTTEENLPEFRQFYGSTFPEVERRLGSFRARRLQASQRTLFPNTVIGLRLAHPRGPLKTEFWSFVTYEKDSPPEVAKGARVSGHTRHVGMAGLNEQDDIDNWSQVTNSGLLSAGRKYRHLLAMGLGQDGPHEEMPGRLSQMWVSENNQRGFYERWQEFMNAGSWADIGIDPITATFEGTATMKG
jgi:phenylpropionate dioxygenase-like ring-hydroxylating dioxygenase large terminal subunit